MKTNAKVALVTGASRGIGRAIAESLADECLVIGTATSEQGADSISSYLQELGNAGQGMLLNVNDADSVASCLATIREKFGAVSVLVNNAGITRDTLVLRMSEADWDQVVDTNLTSVFRLSKAVLKDMMKLRWGRIITIGSVVGAMGNSGQANYAAAKAGLVGYTKSLAREVGPRNITANVVAPGFIDTDMTSSMADGMKQKLLDAVPLGRLGATKDVAKAVSFLASDDAGYITGETLHVNGGMQMV